MFDCPHSHPSRVLSTNSLPILQTDATRRCFSRDWRGLKSLLPYILILSSHSLDSQWVYEHEFDLGLTLYAIFSFSLLSSPLPPQFTRLSSAFSIDFPSFSVRFPVKPPDHRKAYHSVISPVNTECIIQLLSLSIIHVSALDLIVFDIVIWLGDKLLCLFDQHLYIFDSREGS